MEQFSTMYICVPYFQGSGYVTVKHSTDTENEDFTVPKKLKNWSQY